MQKSLDINNLDNHEKKLLFNILKAIKSLQYGSVEITIHDSKVVQIDKTEKVRFDKYNSWDYQI